MDKIDVTNSRDLWLKLSDLANFNDTAYDEDLKNSIIQKLNLGTGKKKMSW